MNEILKALKERRSVRQFKPELVPEETLNAIIEAGLYAASGMGTQQTKIVAVTNREIRDRLSVLNCQIGGWKEGVDPFYGAPELLIVLADKSRPTAVYDGSLVMGNLMLAAHALGVGSCWIHRAKEEFEMPEGKALLKKLGIEGDWEGVGHCALGYAAGDTPSPAPRKEGRVHYLR